MVRGESGNVEALEGYLAAGADVNALDERGRTPLLCAIARERLDSTRLLLDRGASATATRDREEPPLIAAVKKQALEIARLLVERGAIIDQRNSDGKTALYFAVTQGSLEFTQLLLDLGANATIKSKFGRTPLDEATSRGFTELVEAIKRAATRSVSIPRIVDRVAIAGADDGVEPAELDKLSRRFPFVEWSILYRGESKPYERYPSLEWIGALADLQRARRANGESEMRLSLHLCTKAVKDLIRGRDDVIAPIREFLDVFGRAQLNVIFKNEYQYLPMLPYRIKETLPHNPQIIIQLTGNQINYEIGRLLENAGLSVAYLFDASGGHGRIAQNYPVPYGEYCGYAGGLSPENLAEEYARIAEVVGERAVYLDMESGVRDQNDRFVLNRAIRVLENAASWIGT